MPLILGANSVSGYTVKNSLRFNSGSSDNLSRTPSSTTNRRTFTLSTWVKKTTINTADMVLACGTYLSTSLFQIYFENDKFIVTQETSGGSIQSNLTTTQLFRDVSAWYHLVLAIDTTQATASNRVKIYLNGNQITSFSTETYPSQNLDYAINTSSIPNVFGTRNSASLFFDGYMSEVYMIDGTQLTPTSFGETDENTGIWKPKAYTGTYGTNGFYLQFKNSASLGTDSSGNGNTFTVNNLTSIDQTTDTPTNNFCTINPTDRGVVGTAPVIAEGNLKYSASSDGTGNNSIACTIGFSQGKWYWESKRTNSSIYAIVGIMNTANGIKGDASNYIFNQTGFYGISDSGKKSVNGSVTSSFFTAGSQNDIFMYAYDMDNLKFYIGKNGTWLNSGVPTSGATGTGSFGDIIAGTYYPALNNENYLTAIVIEMNFGNPISSANSYTDGAGYGNFSYAVPSGYYALNTKNLANFG